jgi:hypothetical protein
MHVFGGIAGRQEKSTDLLQIFRPHANLLLKLALGAHQHILAGLGHAGRQLEQFSARGVAILADKPDLAIAIQR